MHICIRGSRHTLGGAGAERSEQGQQGQAPGGDEHRGRGGGGGRRRHHLHRRRRLRCYLALLLMLLLAFLFILFLLFFFFLLRSLARSPAGGSDPCSADLDSRTHKAKPGGRVDYIYIGCAFIISSQAQCN